MRLFSYNPKNSHIVFGALTLLIGSTIMFVPLLQSFFSGEMLSWLQYGLVSFVSYLFVTWTLIEVLHVQMLLLGADVLWLTIIAAVSSTLGLVLDYVVWYSVSKAWLSKWFSQKKIARYMRYIEKYGYSTLFVFGALPLPIPILMLTAGLLRLYFPKALLYSFLGMVVKYTTIALVMVYWL